MSTIGPVGVNRKKRVAMDQVVIYLPAASEIRHPPIPDAGCAFAASALVSRVQVQRFAWVGRPLRLTPN